MGTGALGGTLLPRRGERVGVGAVVGMARLSSHATRWTEKKVRARRDGERIS
jgi:hypothetical protein